MRVRAILRWPRRLAMAHHEAGADGKKDRKPALTAILSIAARIGCTLDHTAKLTRGARP
jgi:hypothetical protein